MRYIFLVLLANTLVFAQNNRFKSLTEARSLVTPGKILQIGFSSNTRSVIKTSSSDNSNLIYVEANFLLTLEELCKDGSIVKMSFKDDPNTIICFAK